MRPCIECGAPTPKARCLAHQLPDVANPKYSDPEYRRNRRTLMAPGTRCKVYGCVHMADEVHHILPLREGGTNDIRNLMPVCRHHHVRLGDMRWTS